MTHPPWWAPCIAPGPGSRSFPLTAAQVVAPSHYPTLALCKFFTCHNWFSHGGRMSSPRGRCSSSHTSSCAPRQWARFPFLQCKSPLLWRQACSHQHPGLLKPNGLCVELWSFHDVVDPCVLITAFSPSTTNFFWSFLQAKTARLQLLSHLPPRP